MGYFYLLGHIFAENAGKILDKYNYNSTSISPRESLRYTFGAMTFFVAAFVAITRPDIPELTSAALLSIGLVVLISFVSNLFDEQSIKINDVSLREPLSNFKPIMAGFIGFVIFPDERELTLLLALILGAVVVSWGIQPKKLGKLQKRGIILMCAVVLLEAVLKNVFVFALDYFTPEIIALVRLASISFLLFVFYRPKPRSYKTKNKAKSIAYTTGFLYAIGTVLSLYALQSFGLLVYVILTLFSPALRYISAYIFLGDKAPKERVISSALLGIIAAAVAVV